MTFDTPSSRDNSIFGFASESGSVGFVYLGLGRGRNRIKLGGEILFGASKNWTLLSNYLTGDKTVRWSFLLVSSDL